MEAKKKPEKKVKKEESKETSSKDHRKLFDNLLGSKVVKKEKVKIWKFKVIFRGNNAKPIEKALLDRGNWKAVRNFLIFINII